MQAGEKRILSRKRPTWRRGRTRYDWKHLRSQQHWEVGRSLRREGETASIMDDSGWEERYSHAGCSVWGGGGGTGRGRGEGGRPDGKRRGRAAAVGAERAGPAGGLHRIPRLAVLQPTPELTDDFLQKQAVFVALEKGPPVRGPHSHPGRPSLLSTTTHNQRSCQ